ncbi:MAG: hypothetical protein M3R24_04305 [Chloroflexota bacterium]|nr:hypothetical protein [Chloroflexota bacterium]PLS78846.1 MAG: hypothetical protein CYG59_16345 [Chloroflexota bacterium]
MSGKKITFGKRPEKPEVATVPETWVDQRHEPEGKQRLTLDIDHSLHARIKAITTLRGKAMVRDLRELLEREYSMEVLQDLIQNQRRK